MAYKRACENWLSDFGSWAIPRCESPHSFILWGGLFTLASAIRRQVIITKEYLGGWDCYPHMYAMMVGPAGKVRKTTSANFGSELLESINFLVKGPQIVSQASLFTRLVDSPDNTLYMVAEEFSDLLLKDKAGDMYQFLTSVFDGRKSLESSTVSRGTELANKPCINMFAATTPEWMQAYMPEAVIGGGFASRVVFLYEDQVSKRRMYYKNIIDRDAMNELQKKLSADLQHIAEDLHGEFRISDAGMEYMESWYSANADGPKGHGAKLSGYYQRKPTHIHKVAMLLRIAYSDDLILDVPDFESAITIVEQTETRLASVFAGVGKNPYSLDNKVILRYVRESRSALRSEMMKQFETTAPPKLLLELIDGLVMSRQLNAEAVGTDVIYTVPNSGWQMEKTQATK